MITAYGRVVAAGTGKHKDRVLRIDPHSSANNAGVYPSDHHPLLGSRITACRQKSVVYFPSNSFTATPGKCGMALAIEHQRFRPSQKMTIVSLRSILLKPNCRSAGRIKALHCQGRIREIDQTIESPTEGIEDLIICIHIAEPHPTESEWKRTYASRHSCHPGDHRIRSDCAVHGGIWQSIDPTGNDRRCAGVSGSGWIGGVLQIGCILCQRGSVNQRMLPYFLMFALFSRNPLSTARLSHRQVTSSFDI